MQRYLDIHGKHIVVAANVCRVADPLEIQRFAYICAFLADNPELLSWRGRNKPSSQTMEGISQLAARYFSARYRYEWPAEPTTIPDEAVSIVIQLVYGYSATQSEQIKREHQHSMSAENIVGVLLERYIAMELEPFGWVWCAGDFVKAVDFIKYQPNHGGWQAVQVKNRNNTENSSAAAIRNGTAIEKWYRTNAQTGLDNWRNFPEPEFRDRLSEGKFRQFIRNYLSHRK